MRRVKGLAFGIVGVVSVTALIALWGESTLARDGYFRPPCRSASVALGKQPGRILFTARCLRRHGHKFAFTINRGDRRGRHVTISSFSLKPSTRGRGAVYRRGRCQRVRQAIACDAYADGYLTMRGWLTVPIPGRCRSEITMTQGVPSRCSHRGDTCPAVLVVNTLFRGLPSGC